MNKQFLSLSSLTTTHLRQVTNKIGSQREEQLVKLDQAVNSYLLKRRDTKNSQQQESFEGKIRAQLIALEEQNDHMMKQLEVMSKDYEKDSQEVRTANAGWNQEQNEEFGDNSPLQELVRDLISQLVPFKKVTEYVHRLEGIKLSALKQDVVVSDSQEYFQKIDQILGDDNLQETELTHYSHSAFY